MRRRRRGGSTSAPATSTAPTSTAPAGASLAIKATATGEMKALTIPESVPAGLVTVEFTNSDTMPRSAQFIRVTGEQTVDQVLQEVFGTGDGAPTP